MLRNIPITQTSTSKVANTFQHITTSSRTLYKSSPNSTKHHGGCFYNCCTESKIWSFEPPIKAAMRGLNSPFPTHHIHLCNPPIPPKLIIFKLPHTYHTTNHRDHHYNHHTPDSSHNCHTTSIQPSHIQLHTQTRVRAWTYTHYYCCSDLLWHAIAMQMLCDSIMSQSICIALYLAMSSLP